MLGRMHYRPLSKKEMDTLLHNLANEEGLGRLPAFLEQCADTYRNQFLYTKDERFRGAVLALVALRERVMEKRKNLTKGNKNGRMKETY